ncbi:MAG: FKBP-type peptidyl-prolyl cis-trans isomerase [Treponema sp.]|nr:FKBP-type peptidyl-prolyl cis-trans isomerase [Treponema sp.]
MKRCIISFCFFLLALSVYAEGIREDLNFSGGKARTSYAFGMTVGSDLQETGLEIDYTAFTEGLRAAMEQKQTIMDRDEALEIVQDAFESAMGRQAAVLREKEGAFLAQNASQPGIKTTDSGLQYLVIKEGNGPKPESTDTVRVHYQGSLIDGVVFDSSQDRGEPEEIPLNMVIPGWSEGIMLMSVGSKYQLFIPSNMAYGERGAGQIIPPYSTLIFTIELLDIVAETENGEEEELEL